MTAELKIAIDSLLGALAGVAASIPKIDQSARVADEKLAAALRARDDLKTEIEEIKTEYQEATHALDQIGVPRDIADTGRLRLLTLVDRIRWLARHPVSPVATPVVASSTDSETPQSTSAALIDEQGKLIRQLQYQIDIATRALRTVTGQGPGTTLQQASIAAVSVIWGMRDRLRVSTHTAADRLAGLQREYAEAVKILRAATEDNGDEVCELARRAADRITRLGAQAQGMMRDIASALGLDNPTEYPRELWQSYVRAVSDQRVLVGKVDRERQDLERRGASGWKSAGIAVSVAGRALKLACDAGTLDDKLGEIMSLIVDLRDIGGSGGNGEAAADAATAVFYANLRKARANSKPDAETSTKQERGKP